MAEIPGGKTVCARHPPPGKSPVFPGCARVRNSPPNSGDTVWYRDKGHVVSPSARSRQDAAVPAYSMLPARCASRYDLPCMSRRCLPTDIMNCGPVRGRHGLIGSSCTNGLVGYAKQPEAEFLLLISTPEGHMCPGQLSMAPLAYPSGDPEGCREQRYVECSSACVSSYMCRHACDVSSACMAVWSSVMLHNYVYKRKERNYRDHKLHTSANKWAHATQEYTIKDGTWITN